MHINLKPARPGSSILEVNTLRSVVSWANIYICVTDHIYICEAVHMGLVPIAYLMSRIVRFPFQS